MCPTDISVAMFTTDAVAAGLIQEEAAVHKRRPSVEISHVLCPMSGAEGGQTDRHTLDVNGEVERKMAICGLNCALIIEP